MTAIGGFGITDELEVLATYGFALQQLEARGTVHAAVGYAAVRDAVGGTLEIIARADAGYDLLSEQIAPITIGRRSSSTSPATWRSSRRASSATG